MALPLDYHTSLLKKLHKAIAVPLFCGLLAACSNRTEKFESAALTDYLPLSVGRSYTYRLDSLVFTRSGTVPELHRYQLRHRISGQAIDNLGRHTFIIQRLINNENGSGDWQARGSFYITPQEQQMEVITDNMRVIALTLPFRQGFTWKGNSYLIRPGENSNSSPYSDIYDMFVDDEMYAWDFSYSGFGSETIEGQQYDDVWTIQQSNDSLNIPPTPETAIGYKAVSTEKYARGIGLVYKDLQLYDYQGPGSVDNPSAHYTGFGIRMWLIARD
ncbi:hypothetical protein GCM10027051_07310 [Niabella terrae]